MNESSDSDRYCPDVLFVVCLFEASYTNSLSLKIYKKDTYFLMGAEIYFKQCE